MNTFTVNLTNVAKASDLSTLEGRVAFLENNPGTPINFVVDYAALPDVTTAVGSFYWVSNSSGTSWLPGNLGGTYRQKGLYFSNGIDWEFTSVPYQATQSEVNTGTDDDKFVTSKTLKDSSQWSSKQDTLTSGTNIKTVNGSSLLGSGDIVIESFVLEGTNYLSVLAQGTPEENGQALKDAYAFAQTMTPNGGVLNINNRVVILLAPGLYSFDEAVNGQFIVNTSYIDFESLSGHRDVYFSSIEVLSPNNGIDVRLSGIDTTMNKYYTHAAFAVSSSAGAFENIIVKNCKGGNFSFSSFSSGFKGVYEDCEALQFSFGSTGNGLVAPLGINGIPSAFLEFFNYGTFKNCNATNYSFCTSDIPGAIVSNLGTIENCKSGNFSFIYGNASFFIESNGTILNCESGSKSFVCLENGTVGNQANNIGNILSCKGTVSCFAVHLGDWNSPSCAQNFGTINNCIAFGNSFCVNPVSSIGANWGSIFNCTSTGNESFMGKFGENSNKINNCLASTGLCSDNPAGIFDDIYRCTLTNSAFTVGATGGGRVVLGIDNTGVVNY